MPNLYNAVDLHETTKAPAIALQLSHLYHKRCMIVVENSKFKASLSRKLAALIAWAWTEILLLWISDAINYKDIFQFMSGPEKNSRHCYFNFHIQDNGIFQESKGSLGNQKHGVTSNNRFPLFLHINQFFWIGWANFPYKVFFFQIIYRAFFVLVRTCSVIFAVRMRKSSKYCCFFSRNSMRRKKKLSNIYVHISLTL